MSADAAVARDAAVALRLDEQATTEMEVECEAECEAVAAVRLVLMQQ